MRIRDLIKCVAKKFAALLLGEYSVFNIYSCSTAHAPLLQTKLPATFRVEPVDDSAILAADDPLIRMQANYAGTGSHAYACFDRDRIVGVCFYWFGARYVKRNFWTLLEGEAKLVQIVTLPDMRGRGVATMLISSSCRDMLQRGFDRVYARIWHSNSPSLGAFERAGWSRIAVIVEINPLRRSRPFRFRFNSK